MKDNRRYFVVTEKAVPDVLLKVVEAKRLLDIQQYDTVQEAVEAVGISRSSFYKYKDGNVLKAVSSKFASADYQITSYEMNEEAQGCYRVTMVVKARRMNEEGVLLMLLHDFPELTVNRIV